MMRGMIGSGVLIVLLLGLFPARVVDAAPQNTERPPSTDRAQAAADERLREGLQLLAGGDAEAAAAIFEELVADSPADVDQKTLSVAAGKAYAALKEYPRARKAFEAALERAAPGPETIVLRLAAADAALRGDQPDAAIEHCTAVLAADPTASQRQLAMRTAVRAHLHQNAHAESIELLEQHATAGPAGADEALAENALRIGTTCLKAGEVETAFRSYQWYLSRAPEGASRQVAELGAAWAAAMGAEPPEQAAERLQAFLKQFPDSPDRTSVLQAEAACWRQANRHERANETLRQLLTQTVDPAVARRALEQLSTKPHEDQSDAVVRARLTAVCEADADTPFAAEFWAAALRDAAVHSDEEAWPIALDHAIAHEAAREILGDALMRMMQAQADAYAERLAAHVLGRLTELEMAAAVEAVALWAADSGRWSMLSLASEDHDPNIVIEHLTPASSRLLAEALMQSGQRRRAKTWFEGVIEWHGVSDFATLLRCAELSVALDPLPVARKRLAAAKAAAANDADKSVIEILVAEQRIREAKLDDSRAILERVVRWEEANPEVRCRAQWLIGETYLLQERYAEAVDAYRRVELLDTSKHWTPAALVQAGKAFEKMGRSREAATCYSGLIQRFADSAHAELARKRLVTMRQETKLR